MGKIISLLMFIFVFIYVHGITERIIYRKTSTDGFTYTDRRGQLRYLKNNAAVHWGKGGGLKGQPLVDDKTGTIYVYALDVYRRNQAKLRGEEFYELIDNKNVWTKNFLKDAPLKGDTETTKHVYLIQLYGREYVLDEETYTILRESRNSQANNCEQPKINIEQFNELMNTKVDFLWNRPDYIECFAQIASHKGGERNERTNGD